QRTATKATVVASATAKSAAPTHRGTPAGPARPPAPGGTGASPRGSSSPRRSGATGGVLMVALARELVYPATMTRGDGGGPSPGLGPAGIALRSHSIDHVCDL